VTIPGLLLAESDYTRLALELAVREPKGWRDILDARQQDHERRPEAH
jgi:hypothetical protein